MRLPPARVASMVRPAGGWAQGGAPVRRARETALESFPGRRGSEGSGGPTKLE